LDTIKLEWAVEYGPTRYLVGLSFQIQPLTSCQDQYYGLIESAPNVYQAAYTETLGQRCKQFAQARPMWQKIVAPLGEKICLNGKCFVLKKVGDQVVLE
jgi:hypothetical protein